MDTVACPECGTENPASAMNCRTCGINLQSALEHPEELEVAKLEAPQREEDATQQGASQSAAGPIVLALLLLLACGVLWVYSMLWLAHAVGPCARGGVHYYDYQSLISFWLALLLPGGYFVVAARIFVTEDMRKRRLNWLIVAWIVAAGLVFFRIDTLCGM